VERNIVVPDVLVVQVGKGSQARFRVQLNADVMPRLRVHDIYANALRQHKAGGREASSHAALQQRLLCAALRGDARAGALQPGETRRVALPVRLEALAAIAGCLADGAACAPRLGQQCLNYWRSWRRRSSAGFIICRIH
jgi:hypothetical protein